jgi:ABC-type phosphate/phosphonate transport system ATPase subunit
MITIENLEYRYPDGTSALKGINLTIAAGEWFVICGPPVAKPLLRHLNGLLAPTSGTVRLPV